MEPGTALFPEMESLPAKVLVGWAHLLYGFSNVSYAILENFFFRDGVPDRPRKGLCMNFSRIAAVSLLLVASAVAAFAAGGTTIVRISDTTDSHCINVNKDAVTIYLRRFITDNHKGWFTQDKQHGVLTNTSVIGTTGGQNGPQVKFPTLSKVTVSDFGAGQISVPLEFPIVSDWVLKQDRTRYTGLNLDVTLIRLQGRNKWGAALEAAADNLSKLPIPVNPYTEATSQALKFVNAAVDKSLDGSSGDRVPDNDKYAEIALHFGSADIKDANQCGANNETTGTFALITQAGVPGNGFIADVNNLGGWCFDADKRPDFQIVVGHPDGAGKCPAKASMVPLSNNYLMFYINSEPATDVGLAALNAAKDESKKRCAFNEVKAQDCFVKPAAF
jgi:hypothetical protein